MELQFQKVGGRYEAEFEATGDFNLHCERKGAGNFKLFQKGTPEGQYATESSYADHNAEAVVDKDFSMLVYPKHIKVVSEKEVTYCVATISGGGSSAIIDNPDDYEKIYTVTATDADGATRTATAEELQNGASFIGFDPSKIEIVCEYIKNGTPIKFVPKDYSVNTKVGNNDGSGPNAISYAVVDGIITISVKWVDWYWSAEQLEFIVNGEEIFKTYIKAT